MSNGYAKCACARSGESRHLCGLCDTLYCRRCAKDHEHAVVGRKEAITPAQTFKLRSAMIRIFDGADPRDVAAELRRLANLEELRGG